MRDINPEISGFLMPRYNTDLFPTHVFEDNDDCV
jgi:hypothetical protein